MATPIRTLACGAGKIALLSSVLVLLAGGASALRFGSVGHARAYLDGHVLVADPPVVDLGEVAPGKWLKGSFVLTNLSMHPVRVQGNSTTCSCTILEALPIDIAAGASRQMEFSARVEGAPDATWSQAFEIYHDAAAEPLVVAVHARVAAAGPPPPSE